MPASRAILTCLLLFSLSHCVLAADKSSRPPNIIFILCDDVGLGNIGCYGGDKFKTPHIDSLAQTGMRFDNCFSEPLCGPSRAQIMTGRYAFRTGMTSNQTGHLLSPARETMMPKVLKPAGYVTAQIGKWSQLPLQPGDWGFDEYLRFKGSGKYWASQDRTYTRNGREVDLPPGKYLPDLMHEFLVDFITRHKDQPFYAYYSLSHIHGKIMRTPDSAPGSTTLYADNVAYMDKLVGRLVAELDRLGLREQTLLLFVGDNGTASLAPMPVTVNGRELSGRKGTMLEGGSRVPMIVNWKGTIQASKVLKDLVDFSDFFPTFAELAGARLPAGVTIDGHSFVPQLRGQPGTPREWVYVELSGKRYIRTSQWKLTNGGDLFDMSQAPFKEILVPKDPANEQAVAARKHLDEILTGLAGKSTPPAAGPKPTKIKQAQKKAARKK